jgi:hypothetical protein
MLDPSTLGVNLLELTLPLGDDVAIFGVPPGDL